VGSFKTSGYARGVAIKDSLAYVTDGDLSIISVSDPSDPVEVGHYDSFGSAQGVAVRGSYAYIIDAIQVTPYIIYGLLQAISVSDPSYPVEVGDFEISYYVEGITTSGRHVYVSDAWDGLRIILVSRPWNLVQVGYYDDSDNWMYGAAVNGDYVYVAEGRDGMIILEYYGVSTSIENDEGEDRSIPRSYALSQNYPNPFNPSTTISIDVPESIGVKQPVSLAIYDVRGQLVRTLINSNLEPGRHKIYWDGRDDRRQSVASGIYLYTLKADEERFTRKMTVLK
jgi:hypothetical protein